MPINLSAAAFALSGLIFVMAQPEPSWRGAIVGFGAIVAFCVAAVLPRRGSDDQFPLPAPAGPAPAQDVAAGRQMLGLEAGQAHPAAVASAPTVTPSAIAPPEIAVSSPSWTRRRSRRSGD